MGMMEVLVGAISGSVAGALVGLPMLYAQNRMSRRTEIYQRSTKAVSMAWEAAHEAERIITGESPDVPLSIDALSRLRGVGGQLSQHGMLCLDNQVRARIEESGHLLSQLGKAPATVRQQIALVIARDAQSVCAAFLREDRSIPSRPRELEQHVLSIISVA